MEEEIPSGVVMTSQTFPATVAPPPFPYPFRSLVFSTPVTFAIGEQFAVVLSSPGTCQFSVGPVGDPYPGGDGWFITLPNPLDVWVDLGIGHGRQDLPFQTLMEPANIEVSVDIKPGSCPNQLNSRSRGVVRVALLGTADFDVTEVDPNSIQLEGVPLLRAVLEDVATALEGPIQQPPRASDCTTVRADGFTDLSLKFDAQAVVAALGNVSHGEVRQLNLTGTLFPAFRDSPIEGGDVVEIKVGRRPGQGQ